MDELRELALNRSEVYAFLGQFYNAVPDRQFVEQVRSPDFIENLRQVSMMAPGELGSGVAGLRHFLTDDSSREINASAEELAVEFTRLFRGLKSGYGPPPPYESVYREEGQAAGSHAEVVMRAYLEAGLALDGEYGGPPDYIGTELKFLSLAGYREAKSWDSDKAEAVRLLRLQEEFVREHAMAWIPRFCEVMLQEAESGFYQDVAKITRGFLEVDAKQLREAVTFAGEMG